MKLHRTLCSGSHLNFIMILTAFGGLGCSCVITYDPLFRYTGVVGAVCFSLSHNSDGSASEWKKFCDSSGKNYTGPTSVREGIGNCI
jgi:hypothetical protein